jgi:ABC-type transport system involved in multi-copper enzyme maturation permease subunit
MTDILNLFRIELLKLIRNRQFLALAVLMLLGFWSANYVVAKIYALAANSDNAPAQAIKTAFLFPSIWQTVAYISRFVLILPCMIIIMHTCAEYTYRTHRQNIIDGMSRAQYVSVKILLIVALALLSTLLVVVSALLVGSYENGFSMAKFQYIPYFFLQALTYIGLAFLLSLLMKKTALTIGIFFMYALVLKFILEHYLNKALDAGDLSPLVSVDSLIPLPMFASFIGNLKPEPVYFVVSIAYLAIFAAVCYYRYKKQDL